MSIIKAVITWDDGQEGTFEGVPASAAIPLDLSTIPTEAPPKPVDPAADSSSAS